MSRLRIFAENNPDTPEFASRDFGDIARELGKIGGELQAQAILDLQLRRLAAELPADALVLETDAPDIPPHWLYVTAADRSAGHLQGRNTPGELPRIAQQVAQLRGEPLEQLAQTTTRNAVSALPKLAALGL